MRLAVYHRIPCLSTSHQSYDIPLHTLSLLVVLPSSVIHSSAAPQSSLLLLLHISLSSFFINVGHPIFLLLFLLGITKSFGSYNLSNIPASPAPAEHIARNNKHHPSFSSSLTSLATILYQYTVPQQTSTSIPQQHSSALIAISLKSEYCGHWKSRSHDSKHRPASDEWAIPVLRQSTSFQS